MTIFGDVSMMKRLSMQTFFEASKCVKSSGSVRSPFCQYYCILWGLIQSSSVSTTAQGSLFRSKPTNGSDLIVSPRSISFLALLRARMSEKLCQFCFLRFLGFPLPGGRFRANPGTTRLPASALASTSTSSTGFFSGVSGVDCNSGKVSAVICPWQVKCMHMVRSAIYIWCTYVRSETFDRFLQ